MSICRHELGGGSTPSPNNSNPGTIPVQSHLYPQFFGAETTGEAVWVNNFPKVATQQNSGRAGTRTEELSRSTLTIMPMCLTFWQPSCDLTVDFTALSLSGDGLGWLLAAAAVEGHWAVDGRSIAQTLLRSIDDSTTVCRRRVIVYLQHMFSKSSYWLFAINR